MECKNCNIDFAPDAKFCNKCGTALTKKSRTEIAAPPVLLQTAVIAPTKKKFNPLVGVIAALIVLLIVSGAGIVILLWGSEDAAPYTAYTDNPSDTSVFVPGEAGADADYEFQAEAAEVPNTDQSSPEAEDYLSGSESSYEADNTAAAEADTPDDTGTPADFTPEPTPTTPEYNNNEDKQTTEPPPVKTEPPVLVRNDRILAAGHSSTYIINTDNSLWAFGNHHSGALGDGTWVTMRDIPVWVMNDAELVTAGHAFAMAVSYGRLYGWGDNSFGQLGLGDNENRHMPHFIMDNVIYVSAGANHTLVITQDNQLWAWGNNSHGMLGDGTFVSRNTPVHVMDGVAFASAGFTHSVAIRLDGTLWAWGSKTAPGLISGLVSGVPASTTPQHIISGVKDAAAGKNHTLIIMTDNSLFAWGSNEFGQIGAGSEQPHFWVPTRIMPNVVSIYAGFDTSMAIDFNRRLWIWGYGENGQIQINDGEYVNAFSPVHIANNMMLAAVGGTHAAAISTDDSLFVWGSDDYGQLGQGQLGRPPMPL